MTIRRKKAGDGFTVMKGALANLVADGVRAAIDGLRIWLNLLLKLGQTLKVVCQMWQLFPVRQVKNSKSWRIRQRGLVPPPVFSASEAADALGYMALAGWDAEQSTAALGGVLNLAAA